MTDANEALEAFEAIMAEAMTTVKQHGGEHGVYLNDLADKVRAHLTDPGYVRVQVEPVDIVLGNGDKMIADIYDHDGEWAGVGIFHGGRGVGVRMPEHDGKNIEDLDAICLIRSTSVESLRVLAQECNEAIARMQGAAATKETSHE